MKSKILTEAFFKRHATRVAPDLLGKYLVRKIGNQEIVCMITETEAYDGPDDRASHASRGRTARTEAMFGSPGRFYVYLCYGLHFMLNIVTGPEDYPAAVLIRGVLGFNGPGKLTHALKIDKNLNAQRASVRSGLWFEDRGFAVEKSFIEKTPRVGVAYAGPVWSQKPYRFILNPEVLPRQGIVSR